MDKLKVGRVLIGLTFSAAAWAQGLSTINGSVADPSGSVIPAAKITVIEVETSLPRKAVTNAEGNCDVGEWSGIRRNSKRARSPHRADRFEALLLTTAVETGVVHACGHADGPRIT